MANVDSLSERETRSVLRFLLYYLDLDTRGRLMAEEPVAYVKLFPSAAAATMEHVAAALAALDTETSR